MIYDVIDMIDERLLLACHDISEGGVIAAVSEMILGGDADGKIGVELCVEPDLRLDKYLFSESTGFVCEATPENFEKIKSKYDVDVIGKTGGTSLTVNDKVNLPISKLKKAWTTGFVEAMK